ncbi:CinA family protein [Rhodococcus spelaei]|uniref:CinA family protein n=1 Tax=Rhodococcus spelaei TaxID=2546320 RepID=A0A541AZ48_9NOCA|nr:CinA family protein [Rhodococcus spelaei]TQF65348.1 CinA family protein [Rhodococcus spelaei]
MTDPLTDGTDAAALVAALTARGQTVATAESLTAGLFAATIAGVPGASLVLRGGLVVYATDLKAALAGVDQRVLDGDGPVAASTARELALGAAHRCGADWGVGLTGVAGPDQQDGRPVGTVFLGIAGPDGVHISDLDLRGDRWAIRSAAVRTAVSTLLARVLGST